MRDARVLVVDDSALFRRLLATAIEDAPGLQLAGAASDPLIAWKQIQVLRPDVVTLDIEMPHMDGLTFLRRLMRQRPLPVVMVSSLTAAGADATLEALELGAVDFVTKNNARGGGTADQLKAEVVQKVSAAVGAKVRPLESAPVRRATIPRPAAAAPPKPAPIGAKCDQSLFALGSSTGGIEALTEVFAGLPEDALPTVVVQHLPAQFVASFANRLDGRSAMTIRVAGDGEPLQRGVGLISPGDKHMEVIARGGRLVTKLSDGPLVNGFRPAVDVLFASIAEHAAQGCTAAVLTGMGHDGAAGLLQLRACGAQTLAQDEASSVVYGMPREATINGAAQQSVPIDRMAEALMGQLLATAAC